MGILKGDPEMAKRLGGGEGCSFQRCPSFQTAPINAEYQVDWGFGNEALVATEPGQAGAGFLIFHLNDRRGLQVAACWRLDSCIENRTEHVLRTRPSFLRSPIPDAPTTSEQKTKGTMSILMSLMKEIAQRLHNCNGRPDNQTDNSAYGKTDKNLDP